MGSVREKAIRAYIKHAPGVIRKFTDPVIKNRGKLTTEFNQRREKGKRTVTRVVDRVAGVKRKTR